MMITKDRLSLGTKIHSVALNVLSFESPTGSQVVLASADEEFSFATVLDPKTPSSDSSFVHSSWFSASVVDQSLSSDLLAVVYKRTILIYRVSVAAKTIDSLLLQIISPNPNQIFKSALWDSSTLTIISNMGVELYVFDSSFLSPSSPSSPSPSPSPSLSLPLSFTKVCNFEHTVRGFRGHGVSINSPRSHVTVWGNEENNDLSFFVFNKQTKKKSITTHKKIVSDSASLRGLAALSDGRYVALLGAANRKISLSAPPNTGNSNNLGMILDVRSAPLNDVVGAMSTLKTTKTKQQFTPLSDENDEHPYSDDFEESCSSSSFSSSNSVIDVKFGGVGGNSGGFLDMLKGDISSLTQSPPRHAQAPISVSAATADDHKSLPSQTNSHLVLFNFDIEQQTTVNHAVLTLDACEPSCLALIEKGENSAAATVAVVSFSDSDVVSSFQIGDPEIRLLDEFPNIRNVKSIARSGIDRKVLLVHGEFVDEGSNEKGGDNDFKAPFSVKTEAKKIKLTLSEIQLFPPSPPPSPSPAALDLKQFFATNELSIDVDVDDDEVDDDDVFSDDSQPPPTPMQTALTPPTLPTLPTSPTSPTTTTNICPSCNLIESKLADLEIINSGFMNAMLQTEKCMKRIEKLTIAILVCLLVGLMSKTLTWGVKPRNLEL